MSKKLWSVLAAAVAVVTTSFAGEFPIRDGDRVVFLGDSITEQRLYTTYIEAYALTRHPTWKLSFRNVGWGGDTSWLRQRVHPDEAKLFAADETAQQAMVEDSVGRGLARDVLPLRPTFVTVKFGMNDHAYQAFRPDIYRAYVRSQTQISKVLAGKGARVAFLTPQPIEDRRADPDQDVRNQSLRTFSIGSGNDASGLKGVAAKTGAAFVDLFNPYMDIMLAARAKDAKAFIGGGDAVHPGPAGQTLMAWLALTQMGATPLVSRAEIDATKKSAACEGCQVERLEVADGKVRFERTDLALPLPIDARGEAALALAPVLDQLSRLELQVSGLSAGSYEVTIDGETAGKVTAETLGKGWNLSNASGPITRQAREVLQAIFRKNDLFFNRWRNIQLYTLPNWAKDADVEAPRAAELKRLDMEIAQVEKQIDALRKPVSHRFEVKPAAP